MKYIDSEKLIAEIERRIAILKGGRGDYAKGSVDADTGILTYIESLQRERPEVDLNKPAEWKQENCKDLSEFECAMLHIGESFFGKNAGLNPNDTALVKEQAKLIIDLIESKPAEWSEDDKRKINRIYEILGYAADDKGFLTSKRIIGDKEATGLQDFLKSLRPDCFQNGNSRWKPSEEQMYAIQYVSNFDYGGHRKALESLYSDLKKLCL